VGGNGDTTLQAASKMQGRGD